MAEGKRGVFSLLSTFLTTYQLILFITGSPCNNLLIIMWMIMVSFKGKGLPASHLVPQLRGPFSPSLYPRVLTIRLSTQKYLPSASSTDKFFFQPIKLKTNKNLSVFWTQREIHTHLSAVIKKIPLILGPSLWLGSAPMSQLAYSGKASQVKLATTRKKKKQVCVGPKGKHPETMLYP